MAFKNAVLPPDSLILITGANSYISAHCIEQALEAGYRVRGAVRDAEKSKWLYSHFERYGSGKFELVRVADMANDGAYDEAMKGT
jgi:uncharacterized protein YbjT (DUF2867 family)